MLKNLPITVKSLMAPLFACTMMMVIVAVFHDSYRHSQARFSEARDATMLSATASRLYRQIHDAQALLSRTTVWIQTGMSLDKADEAIAGHDEYLNRIENSLALLESDSTFQQQEIFETLKSRHTDYTESFNKVMTFLVEMPYLATMGLSETYEAFDLLAESALAVENHFDERESEVQSQSVLAQHQALKKVGGVSAIALALSLIAAAVFGHALSVPIRHLSRAVNRLAQGELDTEVRYTRQRDELGAMAGTIENLKQQLRQAAQLERESRMAEDNRRIRQALSSANTNLVVADNEGQSIFVNDGMRQVLNKVRMQLPVQATSALQEPQATLDLEWLMPRDSTIQVRELSSVQVQEFSIGELSLKQVLTPVMTSQGERNGLILEWIDMSEQIQRERLLQQANARESEQAEELKRDARELLDLADAARRGDLTGRVHLTGDSAMTQIGSALDSLFENLSSSISTISAHAAQLNTRSSEISQLNQNMNDSAAVASSQIEQVSNTSSQVSEHVSQISALLSDMSESINEISQRSEQANDVAGEAVQIAQNTDKLVRQLSESSTGIGAVIKTITSIAEQTNLLALNATIEAARAGESGKGFAVVANEVKELAKETARATDDISTRIGTIQSDSDSAVTAIAQIGHIVKQISVLQEQISTGVIRQKHAVEHIYLSAGEADESTSNIAGNLSQVSGSSNDTLEGTVKSLEAAQSLQQMSGSMHELASRFRIRDDSA